jgi:hypothetical protein
VLNSGLEEQTVKIIDYCLNHLAVNVNLENTERVKEFIKSVVLSFILVC